MFQGRTCIYLPLSPFAFFFVSRALSCGDRRVPANEERVISSVVFCGLYPRSSGCCAVSCIYRIRSVSNDISCGGYRSRFCLIISPPLPFHALLAVLTRRHQRLHREKQTLLSISCPRYGEGVASEKCSGSCLLVGGARAANERWFGRSVLSAWTTKILSAKDG